MKQTLLYTVACLTLVSAGQALSHPPDGIYLYSDPQGSSCEIAGNPAGTVFVYVYHEFDTTPGATASQFKIQNNATGFIHVADIAVGFLMLGGSQTDLSISYGSCQSVRFNIVNVLYSGIGAAAPCSNLLVVKGDLNPAGVIEGIDCTPTEIELEGGLLSVNSDGPTCVCGKLGELPTEQKTWGKVKSLYGE